MHQIVFDHNLPQNYLKLVFFSGMAVSLNKLQQENIDQAKEIMEMRVRLEEKIGQEANEMRANMSGKIFTNR